MFPLNTLRCGIGWFVGNAWLYLLSWWLGFIDNVGYWCRTGGGSCVLLTTCSYRGGNWFWFDWLTMGIWISLNPWFVALFLPRISSGNRVTWLIPEEDLGILFVSDVYTMHTDGVGLVFTSGGISLVFTNDGWFIDGCKPGLTGGGRLGAAVESFDWEGVEWGSYSGANPLALLENLSDDGSMWRCKMDGWGFSYPLLRPWWSDVFVVLQRKTSRPHFARMCWWWQWNQLRYCCGVSYWSFRHWRAT